ncbi:xanthine/CO dehydrogenase XdhC/CoxF family maturation factor [Mucilaginibacter gracilis]|uniref:Xanthine/CO dehydrogenase XdhC/CoxF family maturation factor n=1 Tax=Mucilaginibacter gracilis TaxID=423350 RepID=A0A495J8P4_9SPHI|nr:XdhC/CoxI family protein [Mucilaginibacter gracilis]RKR84832.1 xanthine/CO dehydrogenase XdhC/CoxF family maturation factor [Mucilaginibacter gracilis]
MKEISDIVQAYQQAQKQGIQTALATVVLVEGSAYRRAGARMLITENGHLTGAISGGCLEGDALRKARLVMAQQQPMLVTYDTMDDDDAKLGVGLGCNGIIHILIEPINRQIPNNPMQLLGIALSKRQNAVLVTLFSLQNRKAAQPGTGLLLTADDTYSALADDSLRATLNTDAAEVLLNGQSVTKTYFADNEYIGFVEYLKPVIALVIIGAGNDAVPLTKMAGVLGWDVTVIDGRANYARAERFTVAKQIITARPHEVLNHLSLDKLTAIVMMTHNYNYELALLRQLLPLQPPYIGMLGPKKKLDRMLAELEEGGLAITAAHLQHVYGPVGLDIGSESPEEIALSIVAEVKAVLSGRKGYPLKQKAQAIHAPEIE